MIGTPKIMILSRFAINQYSFYTTISDVISIDWHKQNRSSSNPASVAIWQHSQFTHSGNDEMLSYGNSRQIRVKFHQQNHYDCFIVFDSIFSLSRRTRLTYSSKNSSFSCLKSKHSDKQTSIKVRRFSSVKAKYYKKRMKTEYTHGASNSSVNSVRAINHEPFHLLNVTLSRKISYRLYLYHLHYTTILYRICQK